MKRNRTTGRIVLSLAVLTFGLAPFCNAGEATRPLKWQDLSAYQERIISVLLPNAPGRWDREAAFAFLSDHGTRSSTYLSLGMMLRDGPNDRENAAAVVREILSQQIVEPGSKDHGIWRGAPGSDKLDQNWREFVGVGLIALREWYPNALGDGLTADLDAALMRAAEGASARDVGADYTNIALMSAFLLDYVGHLAGRSDWIEQGVAKAEALRDNFQKHGTFAEYNSPTYYGTNLMALGLWCRLAPSPQLRRWGAELEATFWRDIGQFYHAGLKNLCGPYSRAYGMEMPTYPALVALPMAIALNGQGVPLPAEPTSRLYEWAYMPFFSLLDRPVPEDVLPQLREFREPRRLVRRIDSGRRAYEIEALLEENWMMGTAAGMDRPWDQHCPATVHWRKRDGSTGWLLVRGTSGADARMTDRAIEVVIPKPAADRPLTVYLDDPDLDPGRLAGNVWNLDGMRIEVRTSPGEPHVSRVRDSRLGEVLAVEWQVRPTREEGRADLVLVPMPR